jgi:hypothetical protein
MQVGDVHDCAAAVGGFVTSRDAGIMEMEETTYLKETSATLSW